MDKQEAAMTPQTTAAASTSIDWYAIGQTRVVEIDGVRVSIRYVGRKGRRGRIVIEAPAGAVFEDLDSLTANTRDDHNCKSRRSANE
jgi:hypothetical protein